MFADLNALYFAGKRPEDHPEYSYHLEHAVGRKYADWYSRLGLEPREVLKNPEKFIKESKLKL